MITYSDLRPFMVESNKIESIVGTTESEMLAARIFLSHIVLSVDDLVQLVSTLQPDARLRTEVGLDVTVGDHVPPYGGSDIRNQLDMLLFRANLQSSLPSGSAYETHMAYETLHPFMDGNGRSGRLLWLWMMDDKYDPQLGFLHSWYYQSLAAQR